MAAPSAVVFLLAATFVSVLSQATNKRESLNFLQQANSFDPDNLNEEEGFFYPDETDLPNGDHQVVYNGPEGREACVVCQRSSANDDDMAKSLRRLQADVELLKKKLASQNAGLNSSKDGPKISPLPAPVPEDGPKISPLPAPVPEDGPKISPLPAPVPEDGPKISPLPAPVPEDGPKISPLPAPVPAPDGPKISPLPVPIVINGTKDVPKISPLPVPIVINVTKDAPKISPLPVPIVSTKDAPKISLLPAPDVSVLPIPIVSKVIKDALDIISPLPAPAPEVSILPAPVLSRGKISRVDSDD